MQDFFVLADDYDHDYQIGGNSVLLKLLLIWETCLPHAPSDHSKVKGLAQAQVDRLTTVKPWRQAPALQMSGARPMPREGPEGPTFWPPSSFSEDEAEGGGCDILALVIIRPQTFWLYFILQTTKCSWDVLMFVCFQFISKVRLSSFAFNWEYIT